jgi:hypothetical protein
LKLRLIRLTSGCRRVCWWVLWWWMKRGWGTWYTRAWALQQHCFFL